MFLSGLADILCLTVGNISAIFSLYRAGLLGSFPQEFPKRKK
jgi:hypothetical protein